MKKMCGSLFAAIFLAAAFNLSAESAGKEITIKGEGKCAKCVLHETDACQNVVQATNKEGKKTTYYLVQNDTSKNFHTEICKAAKPVTVTGTCKKVDGKLQVTASKIEATK